MYTKNNVGGTPVLPEKISSGLFLFAFPSFRESLESARFVLPFFFRWPKIHVGKRSLDFKKLQEEYVRDVFENCGLYLEMSTKHKAMLSRGLVWI